MYATILIDNKTSYINLMKNIFIFVLLFSATSVFADQKLPNFSYLYKHPNSHYFFTCGAGKLDIFGGSNSSLCYKRI